MRHFSLLLSFVLLLMSDTALAQCSGIITLSTQAEVNAFTCNGLFDGSLIIQDDGTDPITTLNPIHINGLSLGSEPDVITGDLIVRFCPELVDLRGLDGVASIGGEFKVQSNTSLVGTGPFAFLLEDVGDLYISTGISLTSFELPNLITLGGLQLADNPHISSLAGLSTAGGATGNIYLVHNPSLTDISGLNGITHADLVTIATNHALDGSLGFNSLLSAAGIVISNNDGMASFTGFPSLLSSTGQVLVANNDNLTDFLAFPDLVDAFALSIANNPLLEDINGFENLDTVDDVFEISNNLSLITPPTFESLFSTGFLRIENNNALVTYSGFPALQIVGGDLRIANNSNLLSIPSFNLLGQVSSIEITNNMSLGGIEGFNGLNSIPVGNIFIGFNSSLDHVIGFNGLDDVTSILFSNNNNLAIIWAFEDLKTVSALDIGANPQLVSVEGFEMIELVENQVSVLFNSSLSDCCWMIPVIAAAEATASISISDNNTGCDSEAEVLSSAGGLTINCSIGATFSNDIGACSVNFEFNHPTPQVDCGDYSNYNLTLSFPDGSSAQENIIAGGTSLTAFPVGTTTIDFQATAGGLTESCITEIVVLDQEAPTWDSPVLSTTIIGACGIDDPFLLFTLVRPTALDNCTAPTPSSSPPVVTQICGGSAQYVYTAQAVDASFNVSEPFVVTVILADTQPPVINCPPDVNLACGTDIDPVNIGAATAVDNCDEQVLVHWDDFSDGGTCPEVITRIWYSLDLCGNYAECSQTITLESQADDCPADITGDNIVDINDFLVLNSSFGELCSGCPADITGDGQVNIEDFLALNSAFGAPCPGFVVGGNDRSVSLKDVLSNQEIIEQVHPKILAQLMPEVDISIFPQPCRSSFQLGGLENFAGPIEVDIYSVHGKLLLHEQLTTVKETVRHDLNAGSYVVQIGAYGKVMGWSKLIVM